MHGWGVCMVGGVRDQGGMHDRGGGGGTFMAGETASAAGGTDPTGKHSCYPCVRL